MFLAFSEQLPGHVNLHELAVILPSRIDYALPLDTPRAERSHECVVLAPEHDDVRVRLVKVVLEQGKEELFCAHFALPLPSREPPNLYLDAEARFFVPQCFSLLPPRLPWSQREQGSEPSLPSQAMPSPTRGVTQM
jgi:hypothetical protein